MDLKTQVEVISSVSQHYHSGCVFMILPENSADLGECSTVSLLLKCSLTMDLNTQVEVISSVSQHYHSGCRLLVIASCYDI